MTRIRPAPSPKTDLYLAQVALQDRLVYGLPMPERRALTQAINAIELARSCLDNGGPGRAVSIGF